jgi:hypothetical protein
VKAGEEAAEEELVPLGEVVGVGLVPVGARTWYDVG